MDMRCGCQKTKQTDATAGETKSQLGAGTGCFLHRTWPDAPDLDAAISSSHLSNSTASTQPGGGGGGGISVCYFDVDIILQSFP